MKDSHHIGLEDLNRLHGDMQVEYFKIVDVVSGFDQRILTVKSWGITFSLATLGLGFQQKHYGLFLIAAASALSFWIIEWSLKTHQIRYYPRMGDIEYDAFSMFGVHRDNGYISSAPLIDWSWHTAPPRLFGTTVDPKVLPDPHRPQPWDKVNLKPRSYRGMFFWAFIALPHVVVLVMGLVLFALGLLGLLGPI